MWVGGRHSATIYLNLTLTKESIMGIMKKLLTVVLLCFCSSAWAGLIKFDHAYVVESPEPQEFSEVTLYDVHNRVHQYVGLEAILTSETGHSVSTGIIASDTGVFAASYLPFYATNVEVTVFGHKKNGKVDLFKTDYYSLGAQVPEPVTIGLIAIGGGLLLLRRRFTLK